MTSISIPRTVSLARWNAVLLVRNRLAFVYAVVLPMLPLLLLLTGDRGDPAIGAGAVTTMFLVAGLFPIYYNVLSQFVSRREELVLKRLRTGEARDLELMVSIALPGVIVALGMFAAAVPILAAFGQPLPVNPVLYAVGAVLAAIMFAAFAFWTAAWTRSAEAAQLTSMPIIFLASLGPIVGTLPGLSDPVRDVLASTPGAAISELVRSGWFGFADADATQSTLAFADTWSAAAGPVVVLLAWTYLGFYLAKRSMRWEPRS